MAQRTIECSQQTEFNESAPTGDNDRSLARVRADLERMGVHGAAGDLLARRLTALAPRLARDGYEAALAGAALAHGVGRGEREEARRSARDLMEIQRLLGAFADELQKLDEAMGILSAYVQRMRTRAAPAPPTPKNVTLH